jgi:hypothetical protein
MRMVCDGPAEIVAPPRPADKPPLVTTNRKRSTTWSRARRILDAVAIALAGGHTALSRRSTYPPPTLHWPAHLCVPPPLLLSVLRRCAEPRYMECVGICTCTYASPKSRTEFNGHTRPQLPLYAKAWRSVQTHYTSTLCNALALLNLVVDELVVAGPSQPALVPRSGGQ